MRSEHAVCLWIPAFALRCEEARRPDLANRPTAVLAPEDSRRLWQVSPLARRQGVKPGLTVSQAIGLCPVLALVEPDPVFYDEQFAALLLRLETISPVIEPAELGRAFVGVDGLDGLYGGPKRQLEVIAETAVGRYGGTAVPGASPTALPSYRPTALPPRLGWARGKFTAWVAATRARPGAPIIVTDDQRSAFLRTHPFLALPPHPDNHRRLLQLWLKTLGDLAALPESAVVAQFGREGRAAWRLAAGAFDEPVTGKARPQPEFGHFDTLSQYLSCPQVSTSKFNLILLEDV